MNKHRGITGIFILVFFVTCTLLYAASVLAAGTNPLIGKWGYSRLEHNNNGDWGVESGTATFNADGTGTIVLKYNENGSLGAETENITTYSIVLKPDGSYSLSYTTTSGTFVKNIVFSDNGNMFIQDDTDSMDNQKMVVAVRMDPSKTYTNADFSGGYYVIGYDYDRGGTDWPGFYIAASAIANVDDGKGNMSHTNTFNSDGIIRNATWVDPYSVNSDGSMKSGYLSGDGKLVFVVSDWETTFAMKKGDKVYSIADIAGTWAIESFGDEYGSSFNESFGIMTCDSIGNCTLSAKDQRDGSVTNKLLPLTLPVASDGSFGGSVNPGYPYYTGAIGNNGNSIMFNDSFKPNKLYHREIFIGVRCTNCATITAVISYYCDSDSDGYISSTVSDTCTGSGCVPAGCQISAGADCNDSNAAVHPGAAEVCDGKDNDCDGRTDETCNLNGGVIQLPQTGQTKCYDSAGIRLPSCAGTRQDGEIQAGVTWPNLRFIVTYCNASAPCADQSSDCDTDPSTDVVTDKLTGLMWARSGNLTNGTTAWNQAIDYANASTLCGFTNWGIPNINELESLVNADESDTTIWLNSNGFTNVQSVYYWSSTTFADGTYNAWIVSMWNGGVYDFTKVNVNYNVWPVRSVVGGSFGNSEIWKTGQTTSYRTGDDGDLERGIAWPAQRFNDNGNGVITDNLTSLVWLKNTNCINTNYPSFDNDQFYGDGLVTWQHALDFVKDINNGTYPNCGAGYTDWRLPNIKELRSLIDHSRYNVSLPASYPFTSLQSNYYWSSTTYAYFTDYAWIISMWDGYVYGGYKDGSYNYVWPVRSGQVGGSFDYYCDGDNDGYISTAITDTCTGNGCVPAGCKTTVGDDCDDCDDSNILINPGATEGPVGNPTCSDGKDNDCDGKIDVADPDCMSNNLTVTTSGNGGGTVSSPKVINCESGGSDCYEAYAKTTTVKLTATADKNSIFIQWTGACSGTNPQCTVTVDSPKNATAEFKPKSYDLKVKLSGKGTGKVSSNRAGIECGDGSNLCATKYEYNTTVVLTATPVPNDNYSAFDKWKGCDKYFGVTCEVTVNKAKKCTATFKAFNLKTKIKGSGKVTSEPSGIDCGTDCAEKYAPNAQVTLTAESSDGYDFAGWSFKECPGTETCLVTMDKAKSVTANFTKAIPNLYDSSYEGTFKGSDTGTWGVYVDSSGNINGEGWSNYFSDTFEITGTVARSGAMLFTASGGTGIGATFIGQVSFEGKTSGKWLNNYGSDKGTFSGSRGE